MVSVHTHVSTPEHHRTQVSVHKSGARTRELAQGPSRIPVSTRKGQRTHVRARARTIAPPRQACQKAARVHASLHESRRAPRRACTRAERARGPLPRSARAPRARRRARMPAGVPARPAHLDLAGGHLEGELHQAAHCHAHGAGRVHLVPHRVTVHLQWGGGTHTSAGPGQPGDPPHPAATTYSPRCPRTAAPRTSSG